MPSFNRGFALFSATVILVVANMASGQDYGDCEIDDSDAIELTAEANRWLDSAGETGLVLVKEEYGVGFVKQSTGGPVTTFKYSSGDYTVFFGLKEAVSAQNLTLDILRTSFWYVVVDKLPLPGFETLEGWDVRPRTAISSFFNGVEFLSLASGRVKIRVRTSFSSVYGFDTDINSQVPAASPSPEGSYFEVRRSFPLDLTLTASIS